MSCAELARELEEPLVATAPFAQRWELVERPKPWGRDHGLTIPDGKVLLTRRVSGSEPQSPDGRRYLVCTNGARDPCCAIRGPAVAQALERVRPGQVYECSHLGGHRFAANVLVLPDGLCFGRLDARAAPALVEELDAGRLPLEHLRGRTAYEPEQQAAEILARRELRISGVNDLRLISACGSEPQTIFGLEDGRRVQVRVRSVELEPRRVSCRDDKVESPLRWELESLVFA